MARKGNQGSQRRGGKRSTSVSSGLLEKPIDMRKFNGGGYKKILRDIYKSPISLWLASGVGGYFLARFMLRYYRNHPEIAEFFCENFDTVEARLREFRGGSMDEDMARH